MARPGRELCRRVRAWTYATPGTRRGRADDDPAESPSPQRPGARPGPGSRLVSAPWTDRVVGRAGTPSRFVPATRGSPRWHDLRRFSPGLSPQAWASSRGQGQAGAGTGRAGGPRGVRAGRGLGRGVRRLPRLPRGPRHADLMSPSAPLGPIYAEPTQSPLPSWRGPREELRVTPTPRGGGARAGSAERAWGPRTTQARGLAGQWALPRRGTAASERRRAQKQG